MPNEKLYERSYAFRHFPDEEENPKLLGTRLDVEFDRVAGAIAALQAQVEQLRNGRG